MTIRWRALWPTPNWLRLAIVPVLAFLATVTDRNYLADFWHHLARGRAIFEQGQIVNQDLFTFTVGGQSFQDVNWLTQVGYFMLYDAGGLSLVQLVNSTIIAVTMLLVVLLCQRRSGSLLAGVLGGAVAFFGVWEVLTIRPQTLSMLLFVVVLHLLECSKRRPWLLTLVPLLVALWANLHGAFPVGVALVGCYAVSTAAADRSARLGARIVSAGPLLVCLAACVLATFANPYGWEIYRYVGSTSAVAYERQIAEWVRPGPDRLIGIMWMATVAAVVGMGTWRWLRTRHAPELRDLLLLGCFLLLSAGSVRMVAWWMLVSAPVLAELLAWAMPKLATAADEDSQPSLASAGVFALVMLAVVFSLPGLDRFNPLLGPTRRGSRVEEDLEAVHQHLEMAERPGNVYSKFEWGEYLSWTAPPRHRIFMDGRIEIYPDDVWQKYSTVTFARAGWDAILDEYRVDYLVLDSDYHGRTGLLSHVEQSGRWQVAFRARSAVLFARSSQIGAVSSQLSAFSHSAGK